MPIPTLRFSKWAAWSERESLPRLELPGVYAVCVTRRRIGGAPYRLAIEICYFGMTNSKGGLRARLRQFDQTIRAEVAHGGADRFRFTHQNYSAVLPRLYVAVCPVAASVDSPTPRDLRAMGAISFLEYECMARYLARFKDLPAFNRRSAPKHSKTLRSR